MSRAKESRTIRHVEVFDTPSNMGGSFTVSIVRELDAERVEVRVWYGHPTPMGLGAVEGMGRLQVRNQPCRPSQRSQNGIIQGTLIRFEGGSSKARSSPRRSGRIGHPGRGDGLALKRR